MTMYPPFSSNGSLYVQYERAMKTYGDISGNLSRKYLSVKFSSSKWLYSKNLVGHTGCVNALAFSNNGGEFLASGGDDQRVLVWRLWESVSRNTKPRCMKQSHQSNIFCVAFDLDNRHIISAGNDVMILYHDFESGEVLRSFEAEANTNEMCFHPEDNNIFLAAESSFGAVTQFDLRSPTEQTVLAVPWPSKHTLSCWPNLPNFSSAKYNPVDPRVIVTANLKNGVQLWDIRFPKRCLRHFDFSLSAGREMAMSVAFDYTGRYIAAVRKTRPPALYHIDRDTCLAEFFEKGYGNTVTRKSVCFAGERDEFIMTGSEDFNVYLWNAPKLGKDHVGIAKVEQSSLTLKGHRSIVNQACFDRHTATICSSGVEKIIKMWSPFQMVYGIAGDKVCEKRKLYTREEYDGMLEEDWPFDDDCTREDPKMLAMVDQWLLKPQRDVLNESESDDESAREHVSGFLQRDNLYFGELAYDSEITLSSESSDSETAPSPDTPADDCRQSSNAFPGFRENFSRTFQSIRTPDRISENVISVNINSQNVEPRTTPQSQDRNSENVISVDINSQNVRSQNTPRSQDRNSENAPSLLRDSEDGENVQGVAVHRLREIISSQHRPTNSLTRIAELRRNCLRDDN